MATFVRVFFFSVSLIFSCCTEKGASLGRQKEVGELTALKFPRGASVSLSVALANHFPKGPLTDGLNQILEFDFGFPFPEEAAYNTKPIASPLKRKVSKYAYQYSQELKSSKYNKHSYVTHNRRQKRSSKEAEQENFLSRLENVVARLGYDGMACTSRFQCELSKVSPKSSLVEELLVALFKVSTGADEGGPRESCDALISDCPLSILHILLHSQQDGKGYSGLSSRYR